VIKKYTKVALLILSLIWLCTYCVHDMLVINPTDYGIDVLSHKEISFELTEGTESVILFDKKTGVRGKITRFEQIGEAEYYVSGQIDFLEYDKVLYEKFKQTEFYTFVGAAFNAQYKKTENPEQIELVLFEIMAVPGSTETELINQESSVQFKSILQINEQLDSLLKVHFANTQKNVTAKFSWNCMFAVMDVDNGTFSITVKPIG